MVHDTDARACTATGSYPATKSASNQPRRMAPIHDAAAAGNVSEVRRLVEQGGVEPTVLDNEEEEEEDEDEDEDEEEEDAPGRRAPIHWAARKNALFVLRYLHEECDVPIDDPDTKGRAALWHASYNGHAPCVRYCLARGADPTLRDTHRETALGIAAREGEMDALRLLLADGQCGLEGRRVPSGQTPLLAAVIYEHWRVAEALLDAGADPTAEDNDGMTVLEYLEAAKAAGAAPEQLVTKAKAIAAEPQRALLLGKCRLLADTTAALREAMAAAKDSGLPLRARKRKLALAAPAACRARVEALEELPVVQPRTVVTMPWDEEEEELLAVVAHVVGTGGMTEAHVKEVLAMLTPTWFDKDACGEGEGEDD